MRDAILQPTALRRPAKQTPAGRPAKQTPSSVWHTAVLANAVAHQQ